MKKVARPVIFLFKGKFNSLLTYVRTRKKGRLHWICRREEGVRQRCREV